MEQNKKWVWRRTKQFELFLTIELSHNMVDTVGHAVQLIFTLKTKKRIILCAAATQYLQTQQKRSSNASYSHSVGLETWDQ